MPESFGGRLRERREQQAIALATIAQQTKIKASLLEGLEQDDLSHWPSGIFRRAYVRTYAAAIGLNPDLVLQEFLTIYPDRPDSFPADPVSAATTDGPVHAPPTRLRYLLGSAMGSLTQRRHASPPSRPSPAAPPAEQQIANEPAPSIASAPPAAELPFETEPAPAPMAGPDLAKVAE